ncbi:RidA family protein [Hymenobacter defluvii]|uniref:RidA family protein n=1 Tax=Hymenobacter defluvii TaxID=2054411 RepID=A0ABS3TF85_9BACT|nr:RidA family protein [Hymenobacter defluvii]MBO3272321.1 RidA family protein [Hymenobacter defluvii]
MQKRTINPWQWQQHSAYNQAVEVRQPSATLYCAGQAAIDADGVPSTGDMRAQLQQVLGNVEQVVTAAGYQCRDIVHLRIYTTDTTALFGPAGCFDVFTEWVARHGIQAAATMVEINFLAYEGLSVEVEAIAVR